MLEVILSSVCVLAYIKELSYSKKAVMYYVIHVQTGKEDQVIDEIKRYKDHEASFEVFTPLMKQMRKYKNEWKEVTIKCFPGYIFVETEDIKQLFKDLVYIEGYTRLLGKERGSDGLYLPLSEEESRVIDILYNAESDRTTEISDIVVDEGDKIRVVAGPLMGCEGLIVKKKLHKRLVRIRISFAGRAVETDVGINFIAKTNI